MQILDRYKRGRSKVKKKNGTKNLGSGTNKFQHQNKKLLNVVPKYGVRNRA